MKIQWQVRCVQIRDDVPTVPISPPDKPFSCGCGWRELQRNWQSACAIAPRRSARKMNVGGDGAVGSNWNGRSPRSSAGAHDRRSSFIAGLETTMRRAQGSHSMADTRKRKRLIRLQRVALVIINLGRAQAMPRRATYVPYSSRSNNSAYRNCC